MSNIALEKGAIPPAFSLEWKSNGSIFARCLRCHSECESQSSEIYREPTYYHINSLIRCLNGCGAWQLEARSPPLAQPGHFHQLGDAEKIRVLEGKAVDLGRQMSGLVADKVALQNALNDALTQLADTKRELAEKSGPKEGDERKDTEEDGLLFSCLKCYGALEITEEDRVGGRRKRVTGGTAYCASCDRYYWWRMKIRRTRGSD